MIVVNLESGMPTVDRAMIQLRQTLLTAKSRRTDVIKLIHGYGSTGKGGAIRSAVRRELNLRAEAGEIRCYICGEDFSPFDESSRWAIAVILICAGTRITHESIMGLQLSFYRGIHRLKGTKITFFSRLGRKERLFFTICWLLGALALGMVWWAKGHPDWVEQYYSLWFYPRWAGVLAALTTPVNSHRHL